MATQGRATLQPFLDRLLSRSVLGEREQCDILSLPTRTHQVSCNRDFASLGEHPHQCCMVVEGLMGRFDQNDYGDRQITALHIAGDMPNLQCLIQPSATCALQALTTTTLVTVPHTALRAIATKHPAVLEALWRDCMADSMILAQWVLNVGRRTARARVAHLMCEMAYRYQVAPSKTQIRFDLRMNQQHLADATGITSVHVNRTLQSLKLDGLIFHQGKVSIDDWGHLAKIGEFDPGYLQVDAKPRTATLRLVT